MLRSVLVLCLAVLLGACGDHVSAVGSGATRAPVADPATPIPWTSARSSFPPPASPTIAPVPAGVPRCDPKELRLTDSTYQGAMGSLYGASFLVHDGTPCLIAGDFTVRFIDRVGAAVLSARSPSTPYPLNPGWALAGRAWITWGILWCDRADPVTAVEVDYEGTTYRDALRPLVGGAACDTGAANGAPLHGNASVMYPLGTQPTNPPPPPPAALRPSISAPASVRAGDTLNFIVTLTNVSSATVAWTACPNYVEWLTGRPLGTDPPPAGLPSGKPWSATLRFAGIAKDGYVLNCGAATPLVPGASLQFEMRIGVPQDGDGEGDLRWELAEPNAIQAVATVVIDPR